MAKDKELKVIAEDTDGRFDKCIVEMPDPFSGNDFAHINSYLNVGGKNHVKGSPAVLNGALAIIAVGNVSYINEAGERETLTPNKIKVFALSMRLLTWIQIHGTAYLNEEMLIEKN